MHCHLKTARGGSALNYSLEFIVIGTYVKKNSNLSFKNFMNFRDGDEDDEIKPESRSNLFSFRSVPNALRRKTTDIAGNVVSVNSCQKPIRLLRFIIEHFSTPDDVVLDLCAGSHSTAVACALSNRHCISIEDDEFQFAEGCARITTLKEELENCKEAEDQPFYLIKGKEF